MCGVETPLAFTQAKYAETHSTVLQRSRAWKQNAIALTHSRRKRYLSSERSALTTHSVHIRQASDYCWWGIISAPVGIQSKSSVHTKQLPKQLINKEHDSLALCYVRNSFSRFRRRTRLLEDWRWRVLSLCLRNSLSLSCKKLKDTKKWNEAWMTLHGAKICSELGIKRT